MEHSLPLVSEALLMADEEWLAYYRALRVDPSKNLLVSDPQRSVLGNALRGAGSTVALFPGTHAEADDLRHWCHSLDDAWSHDWFNVGLDYYEALSRAQVELINARAPEHESSIPTTR